MQTDSCGWKRKTLDLLASWVWLAGAGVSVLELVGCAGVLTTKTPILVSVTISPTAATVAAGGTQPFTAMVQNTSNTAVTWQVNGMTGGNATVGTISSSGLSTRRCVVLASWVWLVGAVFRVLAIDGCSGVLTTKAPISVSVTISPTAATVAVGGTQPFTAMVQNTSNTAVTWQVNGMTGGNATVGTISSSGLYTAPGVVPNPATVTVTAVSQADATKSASDRKSVV